MVSSGTTMVYIEVEASTQETEIIACYERPVMLTKYYISNSKFAKEHLPLTVCKTVNMFVNY